MSSAGNDASQTLQGDDWAGEMGDRWLLNLDRLESMIEPIGAALLERAAFKPGDRVLDIGSGGGATTRAISAAVAPGGEAVGVDIAPMLVAEAKRRSKSEGCRNARFVCADAGTVMLDDTPFGKLFSRFGSMFFEDPIASFSNLHAMLYEGARIDLAVWGPPRENPWMMDMMGIVRQYVEVPPAEPRAPGPFALADLNYLHEILAGGGFGKVDIMPYESELSIAGPGATPEEAVRFVLSSMGVGRILAEQDDSVRELATADLLALFDQCFSPDKGVMMRCKVWLVSANA